MSTTTLYTTTVSNNVSSNNYTTLYSGGAGEITAQQPYGNSNVEAFLNAGSDIGGNIVQNIVSNGVISSHGLTVVGNTSLGNVSNVHITGGNLNYVLQTDGTGNLTWSELPGYANTTTYIHFDVSSTANNQFFTNGNLVVYPNVYTMAVFKNGINIEPNLYTIAGDTLIINILLNTGDSIDVLPSKSGSNGSNPGGNLTEVQYNGGVSLSGNSSFTFNQTNSLLTVGNISTNNLTVNNVTTLGNVGNVKITGGVANYVLTTDGTGNLNWTSQISSNVVPGGINTSVQFNTNGSLDGSTGFTFNNVSNTLTVQNIISNGSQLSSLTAANVIGTVANATYAISAGSSLTATSATTAGSAVTANTANVANTVSDNAQPNITSVGSLTGLLVNGNITSLNGNLGNLIVGNYIAGVLTTNNQPNITTIGNLTNLTSNGVVDFSNTSNVTLGSVSNLHITGGASGQVLSTNGSGNVSWASVNINPGGANTQIQYNNGGLFAGSVNLTFNNTTNTLSTTNIVSNGFGLTNVNGSNVSGQVGNSLIAGTVYTASQPNITSVGTLTSLTVSGTSNVANTNFNKFNETVISGGSVSGTLTPNAAAGTIYQYTLTGNITLNNLVNAVAGTSMTIELTQDATGGRTLTSSMKFSGGSKTLSTAGNSVDIISLYYNGSTYYAVLSKGYA
jgi:hypothetical protein